MAGIEVGGLEYNAEVAYITATSPVPADSENRTSKASFSEFEFSSEIVKEEPADRTETSTSEPTELSKDNSQPVEKVEKTSPQTEKSNTIQDESTIPTPTSTMSPVDGTSPESLSPAITIPHYTLDTSLSSTPPSLLKGIQEAQTSPPSHKPSTPKFQAELESAQYQYKTVVVYGQAGCGKTNLVEKLVHSNPAIFTKVVSSTTRKRRTNEVAGIDFHYISQKEMSQGIDRGDYLEYVQLQRHSKKILKRAVVSELELLSNSSQKADSPSLVNQRQRSSSKFDLLDEDSPLVGGEIIGTTKQALVEATQQGKPCIVLNVSMMGAHQLRRRGIRAMYILIHSSLKPSKHDDVKPDYTICADQPNEAYRQLQEYVMQLIQDLQMAQTTRYEVAKHEWDSLPTVKLGASSTPSRPQAQFRPITFSEVLTHFQSINFSAEKEQAKDELPKRGSFNRTKLDKKLHDERLLVLAMSKRQLTDKDKLSLRMLQTIYAKLTSRSINCRRIGSHWKAIGFSGVDPADDLQDVGIFGLVQLIYFLDSPNTISLAQEMYSSTKQDAQTIPFCKTSVQVTQIALTALKGGALTKLANKRDQVVLVTNDFYMATFYRFYNILKSQSSPVLDYSTILHSMSGYVYKHARDVLKDFEEYLRKKEHSKKAPSSLVETTPKPFTQLNDYSDV